MTTRAWPQSRVASIALGVALGLGLAACEPYRAPPFASETPGDATNRHFAVIGDLQSTLMFEVWRENNDAERRRLLPEVARRSPAFVVMVGDLVSWGASRTQWEEFDERSADLRREGIPVLPVPGNHDYWNDAKLHLYFAHFPELRGQRWYEGRYGPVGMVFLDSNFDRLGNTERDEQRRFYEASLEQLDADDDIRGILVFLHHPPLTNSSIVSDDADVTRDFLPAFLRRKKTLGMLSGHAHGYERFERSSKAFVVSAGGGGPRGPLLPASERRHDDDLFRGPPVRNFNFVELRPTALGLHVYVVGLAKGVDRFCCMEEFDLAWPRGPARAPGAASTAVEPPYDLPRCYP